MVRSQMSSHRTGMGRLVETRLLETNGKGFYRCRRLLLHQCDDGGGIHPPGEKRPQRHIGKRLQRHRIPQPGVEHLQCLFLAGDGSARTLLHDIR